MMKKLVYSKHSPDERCGLAYFAQQFSRKIGGIHISNFHGFRASDELYINMDILELDEAEISSLLKYVSSRSSKKTILIMHDYRFSYFEDELVRISDSVVNLSGESALTKLAPDKTIELFTPSIVDPPYFQFTKRNQTYLSLAFGFFHPRKKSFSMYLAFYDFMVLHFPQWHHILIPSVHTGHTNTGADSLAELLHHPSVEIMDFVPGSLLTELISASDVGVCFYPTGIMRNNATPMAFFSQGKTVISTYGDLTPADYPSFTLDAGQIKSYDFSDASFLSKKGAAAHAYYAANLSWDVFMKKLQHFLSKRT